MTRDWTHASLAELAAHIVAAHHGFCREQMARIATQLEAAAAAGGRQDPVLVNLKTGFQRLSGALTSHLQKEEAILFPLIERIEAALRDGTPPPAPSFGSVANPIRMMILERGEAETALERMRAASSGFQAPPGAGRMQDLCRALQLFDAALARHVELRTRSCFRERWPSRMRRPDPHDGAPRARSCGARIMIWSAARASAGTCCPPPNRLCRNP